MAKTFWPAEQTFKYEFREKCELAIPLIGNEKMKRTRMNKEQNENENGKEL